MDQSTVDAETVVKLAKNLQSAHSRLTAGEARKWRDVPAEERKIWERLANVSVRILLLERDGGAAAPAEATGKAVSGDQPPGRLDSKPPSPQAVSGDQPPGRLDSKPPPPQPSPAVTAPTEPARKSPEKVASKPSGRWDNSLLGGPFKFGKGKT